MSRNLFRKTLSAPELLGVVCHRLGCADGHVPGCGLTLPGFLMPTLAMFGLKYPSLLSFEEGARDGELVRSNLRSLYGVRRVDSSGRKRGVKTNPASAGASFSARFLKVIEAPSRPRPMSAAH